MNTNFKISGSRIVFLQTSTLTGASFVSSNLRIKIKNQGRKRTAILGYSWNVGGLENENPGVGVNPYINVSLTAIENLANRKEKTSYLHRNTLYVFSPVTAGASYAYQQNHIEESQKQFWLPIPMLIKNGVIYPQITGSSNITWGSIDCRFSIYLADAIIDDPMGDFFEGAILNRGQARQKFIGERRIAPFERGGNAY